MPIYMDRHDVSATVTAEHVAQLHQEDLKVQDQFGCRGLTYWFDDKRKTAFCLVEAPDRNAIQKMHDHAHGQVPHHIIEVEAGVVESFLGRIEDPVTARKAELNIIDNPAFRIIMVVALQPLLQNDPAELSSLLRNFRNDALKILNTYEGRPVKQTDYCYLISFISVSNAIHAAMDIQVLFKDVGKDIMNGKINLKIGLNAGMPVTEKPSIFEDTIKLAERMCSIIDGEIIVSAEVRSLYESENANGLTKKKPVFSLTRADETFLTLLMNYLETVWSDTHLQVDDLNKPTGCSRSRLYRKMIALTGRSPNAFIKDYRLNAAVTLLNQQVGSISEIAFETGFSSPSYFARCFQKKYGRSPSSYLSKDPGERVPPGELV